MKTGVKSLNIKTAKSDTNTAEADIFITNSQRTKKINIRWLKKIVTALFVELKIENAALGIKLVGAKEMAQVNWQFLQHEGSTDVITFDHAEKRKAESGKQKQVHGELFICVDDAILQAREFNTEWQSEVVRYVVHGILHLLDYDDLKPALRRVMKREENRLVGKLAKKNSFAQLSRTAKLRT
jgi:probable rRNA maturation factor